MKTSNEIKRLQQRIYFTYHQDGILDLVIGFGAIGFSIFMATELAALLILSWLPLLSYLPLKHGITVPRFGYVNFTPRKTSLLRLTLMAGLGVLTLAFFLLLTMLTRGENLTPDLRAWLQIYHMVVLGGLFAVVAFGVGVFLGLKRFYLYGLLAVALPALGALVNLHTFIPVLAVGLTVAATGIYLMARFLKRYPREDSVENDVSQ